MVGRLVSSWGGLFSGAMLVSGGVSLSSRPLLSQRLSMIQWLFSGFPYRYYVLFQEAIPGIWVHDSSPTRPEEMTWQKSLRSSTLLEEIDVLVIESAQIGMKAWSKNSGWRSISRHSNIYDVSYIYYHLPHTWMSQEVSRWLVNGL